MEDKKVEEEYRADWIKAKYVTASWTDWQPEPYPDIKDIPFIVDSKIQKAVNKERERILQYLKGLLKANPKASLASVLDLIEMNKPGGKQHE